jgi:hypothetical protein
MRYSDIGSTAPAPAAAKVPISSSMCPPLSVSSGRIGATKTVGANPASAQDVGNVDLDDQLTVEVGAQIEPAVFVGGADKAVRARGGEAAVRVHGPFAGQHRAGLGDVVERAFGHTDIRPCAFRTEPIVAGQRRPAARDGGLLQSGCARSARCRWTKSKIIDVSRETTC